MRRLSGTAIGIAALLATLALPRLPAQHEAQEEPPSAPDGKPAGARTPVEQKRGAPDAPTHDPQPVLPPLVAWSFVKRNNTALAAARAAATEPPPLPDRPAGAGRYVCAVLVCADADVDVHTLLGLRRQDVLLISTPGPFVQPEMVALLEQAATKERLSLVLVLSHTECTTLATTKGTSPRQDALAQRLAAATAEARRTASPLARALVLLQREQLLAASELLRERVHDDRLRVMPGELDMHTGAITWHAHRIDALPLAPVR